MKRPRVEVINESRTVTDVAARAVVSALQVQVREHFAPVWGLDADVRFVGSIDRATSHAWQLLLLDEPNADDGFHELTRAGNPLGKVFVNVALNDSGGWSSTASHELLELLADPDMSRGIFVETSSGPRVYAYEVCDPCQDDAHAYRIDGELVSDFVYPAWFEFFRAWPEPEIGAAPEANVRFDHTGKIAAPYEVVSGGYVSFYDVHQRAWQTRGAGKSGRLSVWGGAAAARPSAEVGVAPLTPRRARAHAAGDAPDARGSSRPGGSRRVRRHLPREAWRPSER